jgi:hypothetical protein
LQNIICEVINITILYLGTPLNVICLRFDKLISSFSSDIIRCNLIVSIEVGLNKGTILIWGQWDLNLARKWGQLIVLYNKAGPRGLATNLSLKEDSGTSKY